MWTTSCPERTGDGWRSVVAVAYLAPLRRNRTLVGQFVAVNLIVYSVFFGIPNHLQDSRHFSAEKTGPIMLGVAFGPHVGAAQLHLVAIVLAALGALVLAQSIRSPTRGRLGAASPATEEPYGVAGGNLDAHPVASDAGDDVAARCHSR